MTVGAGLLLGLFAATTPSFATLQPVDSSPFELDGSDSTCDSTNATLWDWLNPFDTRPLFETLLALSPGPLLTDRSFDVGPRPWTTGVDWFSNELGAGKHYRIVDPRRFSLLRRYTTPASEQYPSTHLQFLRQLDPTRQPLVPQLNWHLDALRVDPSLSTASLSGAPPSSLPLEREKRCAAWNQPRSIVVAGFGSDYDRLSMVDCAGSIDLFALDRVSVLARVPSTPNPGYPLPEAPNPPPTWPDEWVDGVRLLHPRLLWVVQRIGEAFPRRTIQILSGYRRDERLNSPHRLGRALDIKVNGVEDADLFAFCLSLKDVGCGYYPFHPFVHVDVRSTGTKAVYWVDASAPGEPSKYVDSWPYVIESGALAGAGTD
jgi:hypothetical protein